MRVTEYRLAPFDITVAVDQRQHCLTHGLRPRNACKVGLAAEQVGGQLPRRGGLDRPVGYQHGAGTGVKEGATETGHRLGARPVAAGRSEEHTSELQSLMRLSYAVF